MYLIDNTYFKNKYEIENVLESNSGVASKLDDYIETYVIEFLQKLFGAVDFEELNSNITAGVLDVGAPQKWLNFVNGETYTENGKTLVWRGLVHLNGSVKRSLLTNYIYCKIIADLQTNNGQATLEAKNVINNVMRSQYVNTWNELAKEFQCQNGVNGVYSEINGVPFYDYYGSDTGSGYVTLSQYLTHKNNDFENTNLNFVQFQNRLNLG